MSRDIDGNSDGLCRRCGFFHSIRKCTTPKAQCYSRGISNLSDAHLATGDLGQNKEDAEKHYRDKLEAALKKDEQQKAVKKATKAAEKEKQAGNTKKAATTPAQSVQSSKNQKQTGYQHKGKSGWNTKSGNSIYGAGGDGSQSSNRPAQQQAGKSSTSAKTRTPKEDKIKGQIEFLDTPNKTTSVPNNVPHHGVFSVATNTAQATTEDDGMIIASNYVEVSKVPKTLYVYSLSYSRPSQQKDKRIQFNKRREIDAAFQAAKRADALKLEGKPFEWVTDSKNLWSTCPISDHPLTGNYSWSTGDFEYTQPNGKTVTDLRVDVCFTSHLEDIEKKLRTENLENLPDYIRALNANVVESITRNQENTGIDVVRTSVNKVFLKYGYELVRGIRVTRGYFTSIRPGKDSTLLNINTATSAFLPPEPVSQLLWDVDPRGTTALASRATTVEKLLKGAMLRISYSRANYEGSDVDYNSEEKRTVMFTQFGKGAKAQKFFKLLDEEKGKPRKVDPNDQGTSVWDYFKERKFASA